MVKAPKVMQPKASRTIEGLRDTGYDVRTALCDIVDNSIAADASRIHIHFVRNPLGQVEVYVVDNGKGMSEEQLDDAMTYGSRPKEDPSSLGKFGLGLKTASTSMARCLTVVTRDNASSGPFTARWDLDYVVEKDEWYLLYPENKETQEEIAYLNAISPSGSGTVVSWKKVDRIVKASQKESLRKQDFNRLEKTLKDAIELHFHKFIDPHSTYVDQPVEIFLNNVLLKPWDPFGNDDVSDQIIDIKLPVQGVHPSKPDELLDLGEFTLRSYVFKHFTELSGQDRAQYTQGPAASGSPFRQGTPTTRQGIYVYRENRLIAYNTWFDIRTIEPHQNLHRVEFSFDHRLDAAFQIDIKKSKIEVEPELQNYIRSQLNMAFNVADDRTRKATKHIAVVEGGKLHETSNKFLGANEADASKGTSIAIDPDEPNVIQLTNQNVEKLRLEMPVYDKAETPHVTPVETTDGNTLWEPYFNTHIKQIAVNINAGHEFYKRIYQNMESSDLGIQALDALIWSIAKAEMQIMDEDVKQGMKGLRYQASQIINKICSSSFSEPKVD